MLALGSWSRCPETLTLQVSLEDVVDPDRRYSVVLRSKLNLDSKVVLLCHLELYDTLRLAQLGQILTDLGKIEVFEPKLIG